MGSVCLVRVIPIDRFITYQTYGQCLSGACHTYRQTHYIPDVWVVFVWCVSYLSTDSLDTRLMGSVCLVRVIPIDRLIGYQTYGQCLSGACHTYRLTHYIPDVWVVFVWCVSYLSTDSLHTRRMVSVCLVRVIPIDWLITYQTYG